MALLHKATISPSKLDLLASWLPTRSWYAGPEAAAPVRVAAGRFDDPAGEVGIEIFLVRGGEGGPVLHVPLTYRGAPLEGAEAFLVGTTDHSVLGKRWVYDAVGDPVYATVVAAAIREGGHGAVEEFEVDGERVAREPDLKLAGSGAQTPEPGPVTEIVDGEPAVLRAGAVTLSVNRVPTVAVDPADAGVLTACWEGQENAVVLASLRSV
jgi:hypothetical protein